MRRFFLAEPNRHQTLTDIADALARAGVVVTRRMLDDASRDEPDLPLPEPFGMVGRTRVWHAPDVQAALPKLADWFDVAPERRSVRQSETLAAQKVAQAEALERRQRAIAKEAKETKERYEFFRACEAENKAEAEGRSSGRGANVIPPPMGSR